MYSRHSIKSGIYIYIRARGVSRFQLYSLVWGLLRSPNYLIQFSFYDVVRLHFSEFQLSKSLCNQTAQNSLLIYSLVCVSRKMCGTLLRASATYCVGVAERSGGY